MNRTIKMTICFICCFFLLIAKPAKGQESATLINQSKIIGIWQGTLSVPGTELRIVFKISQPKDSLVATLDSPDQGAFGIPTSRVLLKDDSIQIEVKSIWGFFEGKVQPDSATIVGQWKQSGMTFPLVLTKVEQAYQLNRPQEPKPPYPYLEQEVSVYNESAGITLAGTFTRMDLDEPLPAVILISGSGPQDRNETVFGHRPFLVLADHLTRERIAVLRMDDRGVGKSTGDFSMATSLDFASDVLAGINYLKTRSDIDSKRIGLIGHSEGGMIAAMVAAQSTDVAFIILMAGTGLTGEEILDLQADLIARARGTSEAKIAKDRASRQRIFNILKQEQDDSIAANKLRTIMKDDWAQLSDQEKSALGDADAYINIQIKRVLSPWFRFFLTYDPRPTLMKVKCPVIALNGELDLQVPPKQNLTAIEQALIAGGNKHFVIKEFPGLNHLFQTATTGSPEEYARIEETISPAVLGFITGGINALFWQNK